MSNSHKSKYQTYASNQIRGHTEYSQAGYAQQFQYQSALSSGPVSHELPKPIAGGQAGMYSNSGGIPSGASQHHQPMAGPVPTAVQSAQQLSRGNPMQYYLSRQPRPMTGMGPRQMSSVMNQAGQHPSSQFAPVPTLVPQLQYVHNSIPQINQYPQVYQQRPMPQNQFHFMPHNPQVQYLNQYPGAHYGNQPTSNSNNFYPQHAAMYNNGIMPAMPQHQPPAPPPTQIQPQRKKNVIPIINPDSGENVLENMNNEKTTVEKEAENDPNICAQFATQVVIAASEKSSLVESPRTVEQDQAICPETVHTRNLTELQLSELSDIESHEKLTDVDSLGELADTESLADAMSCSDNDAMCYYNKDNDSSCLIERGFEISKTVSDDKLSMHLSHYEDSTMVHVPTPLEVSRESSDAEDPPLVFDQPSYFEALEEPVEEEVHMSAEIRSSNVLPHAEPIILPDLSNLIQKPAVESAETVMPIAESVTSKLPDKLSDAKKNKTKKKKELNKRGESKEGGEMDAYLDSENNFKESIILPSPTASVSVPVAAVSPVADRIPSPVPNYDCDVLNNIPLPTEPFPTNFQNDTSPSEESLVSPNAENDKENVEDSSKPILKYNYKEDQWSPVNTEGKKQYDRDFLMQLQSQPMSLCKPTNLPNLDVIKDKAHIQKLNEINRSLPPVIPPSPRGSNFDFLPNFARAGPPRVSHAAINRRSQPRDSKPKKIISFTNSLGQQIKLHESENAWKPMAKLESNPELNETDVEIEKLKRNVQGVLNKLTPQKFETLLQQVKGYSIDTEEKLKTVIDLTFEKAIDEPNFSVPYANMCKHLAMIKVPLTGPQTGKVVNFRKLLLIKCQKEFEQDRSDELKNEERLRAIEAAEGDKKKELQLELAESEKKMRYRQLGNIRFIGELFKLGMLTEPIMHDCIKRLIKEVDEESLECLCKLLKTIGKELEGIDGKGSKKDSGVFSQMDEYFKTMQMIVEKRLTSSRVRFMLQDLIDLRKNQWVPRRDENNPKTIDQIHKEAEREAREQQMQASLPSFAKRIDDRDRQKRTNRGTTEDGWSSTTKSNKGSYNVVDPTKLKLTKPDEVDSIRLGPGGRGLQSWGRGSSGGTKTTTESDKTTLTNRFNALAESASFEGRRGSQKSAASSRESSRGRNSGQMPPLRNTSSTSKERESLLETVKGLARSVAPEPKPSESKRVPDTQLNGKTGSITDLSLRGIDISEYEMDIKTKPLIEEFLHNNDFEEAIQCVTELVSPNTVQLFMNAAINQILERSSQARYSLGQLLYFLVKKKVISLEQYKIGFHPVFEAIDDISLDVPLIWEYIGEILEPMLEDGEIPLSFLNELFSPCIPSETAGLLVSAVLHCVGKKKGTIKIREDWRDSGLQWSDFLGDKVDINNFILKQKLEFTISPAKIIPSSHLSPEEIKNELSILLCKIKENEEIFDWIDANVSDSSNPEFIRALVSAVHENVIIGTEPRYELDHSKLKSRIPLLSRYIEKNENSELQALFAIQALIHRYNQPDGILRMIFDLLYDDDVITEETFKKWEQSEEEIVGKSVALNSVKSFFTWLRETDNEDVNDENEDDNEEITK